MQVAYYANFFVWFEIGRGELLRSLGHAYRDLEATGWLLPVIEARCEYRRPVHYDDDLTVVTHGRLLSPARVRFEYEVQRVADSVVTAVGWAEAGAAPVEISAISMALALTNAIARWRMKPPEIDWRDGLSTSCILP